MIGCGYKPGPRHGVESPPNASVDQSYIARQCRENTLFLENQSCRALNPPHGTPVNQRAPPDQLRFLAGLHFQADLGGLTADLKVFPQIIVNVKVREMKHFESIPGVAQAIRAAEEELRDSGRVVASLARVMNEAESEEAMRRHAAAIRAELAG